MKRHNRTRTTFAVVGNELKVQTSTTTNRSRPHGHKRKPKAARSTPAAA